MLLARMGGGATTTPKQAEINSDQNKNIPLNPKLGNFMPATAGLDDEDDTSGLFKVIC